MKKFILVLYLLLVSFAVFSQKQIAVTYYSRTGKVTIKDSAYYYKLVFAADSGTEIYPVKEYYTNGNLKLDGHTASIEYLNYRGKCIFYFANGKKSLEGNFDGGNLTGRCQQYYPNGKLWKDVEKNDNTSAVLTINPGDRIINYNDSTGRPLINNGNGYFKGLTANKDVYEEGEIRNGLRNGSWKGQDASLKVRFTEQYDGGRLVQGKTVDSTGRVFTYTNTTRNQEPVFKGGIQKFSEFLSKNFHYPDRKGGSTTTGRIIVAFDVNIDGSISTPMVMASELNNDINDEAVRVLMASSNQWLPAYRYGIPMRKHHVMPITIN